MFLKVGLTQENSEGFSFHLAPALLQMGRGREPMQRCLAVSLCLNHLHPHFSRAVLDILETRAQIHNLLLPE